MTQIVVERLRCFRMRSVLGRLTIGALAFGALALGASAVAASAPEPAAPEPADTTTTTTTTTVGTTADDESTDAVATTTAAPTTTAAAPPLIAEVPPPPARITPERGTQLQVTPTDPPPPTTTTTTLPPHLQLPANSGEGRRVVYHKSRQRVWTVEADGTVSKTHPVSGNLTWSKPHAGTYQVFSRSSYTCNIKNRSICWRYMVRFAKGPSGDNIGFHEIPTNTNTGNRVQSISQLGTPLSGGCVRQSTPDAQYMWAWAPIGTQVVVIQ